MIRIEKLTKIYRQGRHQTKAVDGLDLEVKRGEIFGFLGPNGAGKTTVNKILAGLLQPTSGEVWIDGKNITQEPIAIKRIVAYVPDRPFLYEKLTAFEFLEFVSRIYGIPEAKWRERGQHLFAEFGIAENADQLIESFSHGMKQRLVLAVSLVHEPKLLIVDEPMVGLDPRGAQKLWSIFLELKHSGTTIFLSTHVLSIAEKVCDRIAIINKGKLVQLGGLKEVLEGDHKNLEQVFMAMTE